jgi:hypothetical protein
MEVSVCKSRLDTPAPAPPETSSPDFNRACSDFRRNMLGNEGGAWIWSTHEPSGAAKHISAAKLDFKFFFPAGIPARASLGLN